MKRVSRNHPSFHGLSVQQRKEIIGRMRWPDYDKRKRRAQIRNFWVCLVVMLVTARLTEQFVPVASTMILTMLAALPFLRDK